MVLFDLICNHTNKKHTIFQHPKKILKYLMSHMKALINLMTRLQVLVTANNSINCRQGRSRERLRSLQRVRWVWHLCQGKNRFRRKGLLIILGLIFHSRNDQITQHQVTKRESCSIWGLERCQVPKGTTLTSSCQLLKTTSTILWQVTKRKPSKFKKRFTTLKKMHLRSLKASFILMKKKMMTKKLQKWKEILLLSSQDRWWTRLSLEWILSTIPKCLASLKQLSEQESKLNTY